MCYDKLSTEFFGLENFVWNLDEGEIELSILLGSSYRSICADTTTFTSLVSKCPNFRRHLKALGGRKCQKKVTTSEQPYRNNLGSA